MKTVAKRVVRSDLWIDGAFDARLAREADVSLAVFAARGNPAAAWDLLSSAHVYHVSAAKDELPREWFAQAELLARCPELLCVSSSGAGYDTVDVAACTAAGVAVVNQAGGNAPSVAEHTLGLMLGVSRRMLESDRRMRREQGFTREDVMGHEIRGKTLGLVGIGHTGTRVAALARAFGMEVIATDPLLSPQEIGQRGARAVTFSELLAQSDVVSLHCPRDASTLGLIDAAALARMKRGATLISTARGGIHDEAALVKAMRSGHIAGAGLDVWDQEPPPLDHPLLAMDNVFATFHTAGVTHEARRNVAGMAADQIAGLLASERPPRLVNPEVWPACQQRRARILR
ncbi:MAG: D-3-phosphoglycerate dehydrogenase (phosphoglycerate dehydrogenase)-like protein [Ramlibacter sp.]|uniref:hydroxyacid dehydrogenase n=1 Tax=Ramlibacter sp. TaxID=1917967 RepID=UPI0026186831|nr:hydroxyacid dehydrogenase [Ramlibacter sp.]MDB5750043.1 D-3-phosphoglycerate dehydrogenase (phosphoglycerate dehydrogenase)-like protein [Ramlibacter sp.]